MSEKTNPTRAKSLFHELRKHFLWVATSPAMFFPTALVLVLLDAALSYIIVKKVPCK
jgi:hypothetical protein